MAVQSSSDTRLPSGEDPDTRLPSGEDPYLARLGKCRDDRGYGWVLFAGTLLLILGILNLIEGLAAVGDAHFFARNANYITGSLHTWGWVVVCIGVLDLAVGFGVFVKNPFARWTGVAVLCANAIAQLLMMPAYPFWSLSIVTLDILAIYGLIAYGQRISNSG
jgi:hypothetical protein